MNDEIKEILDRFEKINVNILYPFEMEASDCKKLLYYITNLQEENKHLDKVNCQLRKKINNDIYKSRIDKAIEFINDYEIKEQEDHDIYMTLLEVENILNGGDE